ncbi:MAG: MFS transporter [Bacilli bacterium]|nr:MFS transporter [Bacilli bacterium]MDD3422402.1 MFS transporter [Bacilli bacterium]
MKLFSQYKGLRKEIYYLLIGRIITAMGSFVMPLLTLILRRKLDFTPSQITLCLTIFFLISLPAAIIGGKLTDKFKRKTIIIIFDTITVICYIVAGLIPISNLTIGIVMLAAVFAQIEQPAYDALVADFSLPKDRERAYSLGYLGWNLGFIIGPTLGGLLFENYLGLCFIITGIATFATTLICIFFIHEKDAIALKEESEKENQYEANEEKVSLWTFIKDKKIILYVAIVAALSGAVYSSASIVLPLAMDEAYAEMSSTYYGFASSLNGLVVILATPVLTLLLRKQLGLTKRGIGVLLYSVSLLLFAFYNNLFFIYVGMVLFTVGEVVSSIGSMAYITRRIPASHRGRISSLNTIVYGIFTGISQVLIGFFLDTNPYSHAFYIYLGLGILCTATYFILIQLDKKTFPQLYIPDERGERQA